MEPLTLIIEPSPDGPVVTVERTTFRTPDATHLPKALRWILDPVSPSGPEKPVSP